MHVWKAVQKKKLDFIIGELKILVEEKNLELHPSYKEIADVRKK